MLFVEALQSGDEIERVAREFDGFPLLYNWAEGGKTPPLTYDEIASLGFALIITPIGALLSATSAIQGYLAALKAAGTPAPFADTLMPFAEFTDVIGLPEILDLDARFR
jgi:2-methylisocitrate lyase-like PEP mutase family enzyme